MINAPIVNRWGYTGDGTTDAFPYGGKIFEAADLTVLVDDEEQETGFTITGIGEDGGGTVVFDTPPADEAPVLLVRSVALKQPAKLPTNGALPARTIENALDRMAIVVSQVEDRADRSIRLADADPADGFTPLPADAAAGLLHVSADRVVTTVELSEEGVPVSDPMKPVLAAASTDDALDELGGSAIGIDVFKAADLEAVKTLLEIPEEYEPPEVESEFAAGTRIAGFAQAAAPTGWTKITDHDNCAIRVVSGAGGGTAGSVNFSEAFTSKPITTSAVTINPITIAQANLPAVALSVPAVTGVASGSDTGALRVADGTAATPLNTGNLGSGTQIPITGTVTINNLNLTVKRIDTILCEKDA